MAAPAKSSRKPDLIGQGFYDIPQAARLLGIHQNTLRYWLGETPGQGAIVTRKFPSTEMLTFAELMELHFVKIFRDEEVSLQTIRKAAQVASEKFRSEYPFTVKRFDTDGRSIFATLIGKESDREIVEELKHGQRVFSTIIRPFFRKLRYDGKSLGEFWPLGTNGRIVLDPMRRHGQPIDSETGIPVDTIIDSIKAGGGQDANVVAKWLDIPMEAVQAAIQFDKSLTA